MLEQRAICLIPIPFSDLTSSKKRPVLIISNDLYNSQSEDILVAAITSNVSNGDYSSILTNEDMENGSLLHRSLVRVDKIYSIKQSLVIKTFGKINRDKFKDMLDKLKKLISD